jgi:hypothetical protein
VIALLLAWAIDASSDEVSPGGALLFLAVWFLAGIAGLVIAFWARTKGPQDRKLGLVALGLIPVNILVFFLSLYTAGG